MKRKIILILSVFILSVSVFGVNTYAADTDLTHIDITDITDNLPDGAKDFFKQNDIDPQNEEWYKSLDTVNVFSQVFDMVKNGFRDVGAAFAQMSAVILLYAVINTYSPENSKIGQSLNYIFSAVIAAGIIANIIVLVKLCSACIKSTAAFMLAAVPVLSGIAVLSGSAVGTATAGSAVLFAAQILVQAAAYVIIPLMSAYLAVSVCSGVSPFLSSCGIAESVKNTAMAIMGFVFTMFLGLLSAQTAVAAAADTMGTKTVKFLVSSFVPVAGPALSEAVTTVTASVGLLKSSVGIYVLIAVCAAALPIIIKLVLWRIALNVCALISSCFSLGKIPVLFKSTDSVLSLLIGLMLFTAALFTISLTVMLKAGGAV